MLARGTKTRRASGSGDATDARVSLINVIVASVRVSALACGQGLLAAILKPSTSIFSIITFVTGALSSLGKVLEIRRAVEVTCHALHIKCVQNIDTLTTLVFHS